MHFFSLLATACLVSTAVALPKGSGLDGRLARRAAGRSGQPMIKVSDPVTQATYVKPNGTVSNVDYSSNWAGAVYEAPPSGATFTAVSATFTVPTPTPTGTGSGSYSASAWVGIDGDTCGNAILQTGVDFTATRSSSGSVSYSYDAWYEWYPAYAYDYSGITIAAGDVLVTTVTSSSSKAGVAKIENLTTGKTVTKSLTSSYALCGDNAEWIVEDYESGSSMVPMADWGTVTFTNANALTNKGSETAADASVIDIEQNNKVLTSVSISGSTVKVSYV